MIHFGTAGWRGIIGEDFTFRNVRLVTQAIVNVLRDSGGPASAVVGYDTRFMSEKFATEATKVLSHNGMRALRCQRDTPTPSISFAILEHGTGAGLNFTASHNPPEYNGLKLSDGSGAPALPNLTAAIEAELRDIEPDFDDEYFLDEAWVEEIDPIEGYLQALRELVDLEAIAESGISLAIDPLYGTGREVLDGILMDAGIECHVLHNFRDPYFGGYSPEAKEENLADLREVMAETDAVLGLATDADCDRFAILDSDGAYLNPNDVLGLLLDYCLTERGPRGNVARTVSTTHLLDRIAAAHGVEVFETPVGFKYIGDLIRQGRVVFGGEESAGLSVHGHLPEKDGILACLLVAELAASRGTPLRSELEDLWGRVGRSVHMRRDYLLTPEIEDAIGSRFEEAPGRFAGEEVREVVRLDGVKLLLDEGWFLFRRSGTERALRCYAEAPTEETVERYHVAGRQFLFGGIVG